MKNSKIKSVIVNRYIVLYSCLFEDYLPNWKEFISINEQHLINELIENFFNNYSTISEEELLKLESKFLSLTKKIIIKLYRETKNEILLNHFNNIINKI
ncbi:hypothetical protein [Aliarcobacter cryaerophilus]|uniref:hypothetical protein n=1 Tax=Aliarcobacter cryaerophilus TaxID=28198 RepID=UPI000832273A|nr:hypothetical protein [Aliarcobacter cryaerophilus]